MPWKLPILRGDATHGPVTAQNAMKLRVGYALQYTLPQPTPVIVMLHVHCTRVSDLVMPDHIVLAPSVPISGYRDGFGHWCSRMLAPTGRLLISTDCIVRDTGRPDPVVSDARHVRVEALPEEALVFLLTSRFCDGDRLLDLAWTLFEATEPGWARVQTICDFTHQHITFGYEHARVTRSRAGALHALQHETKPHALCHACVSRMCVTVAHRTRRRHARRIPPMRRSLERCTVDRVSIV